MNGFTVWIEKHYIVPDPTKWFAYVCFFDNQPGKISSSNIDY